MNQLLVVVVYVLCLGTFPPNVFAEDSAQALPWTDPLLCECKRMHSVPEAYEGADVEMLPYSRTGNLLIAAEWLMDLSYFCGFTLKLPKLIDDKAWNASAVIIRYKKTTASIKLKNECHRLARKKYHAGEVWQYFIDNSVVEEELSRLRREREGLKFSYATHKSQCIRKWLGLCLPDSRCISHWQEDELVMHVRQDDIFRNDFSSNNIHPGYWQPPLSYYLRAMTFMKWRRIHVIAQSTPHKNPVNLALQIMKNISRSPIIFYDKVNSWCDDVLRLLCAQNLVEAHSSLSILFKRGLAARYFTYQCPSKEITWSSKFYLDMTAADILPRQYFQVPFLRNYPPSIKGHDNSPQEWVQLLVHGADDIRKC